MGQRVLPAGVEQAFRYIRCCLARSLPGYLGAEAVDATAFIAAKSAAPPKMEMPARSTRCTSGTLGPTFGLVLGGKLKGYVEQLHDRQSDDHVSCDFHPASRFADGLHYLDHVSG
jgi:hypothetical protein